MRLTICLTLFCLNLVEIVVEGFSPRSKAHLIHQRSMVKMCQPTSPPTEANLEATDDDDDFAAMQREIAEMISSTPGSVEIASAGVPAISSDNGIKYNKYIAITSAVLGSFFFAFQHSQPVSGVALMHAMERDSVDLKVAVCNGKPTIIDFYADWCASCKEMAPSMRSVETQYKDRINFISVDGSNSKNADLVKMFRVDGIPHLAFIGSDQEVKTALVGAIPKPILKDQITALLQGKPMPYEGYDAFEEESHFPLADISKTCAIAP